MSVGKGFTVTLAVAELMGSEVPKESSTLTRE